MATRTHLRLLISAAAFLGLPGLAAAQQIADGVVQGTGMVVLERQPEILRAEIHLLARGEDLEEALHNLQSRREQALARLAELGATQESIEFHEPSVLGPSDRRRQLEMMLGRQDRRHREPEPQPVIVTLPLTAEWPLAAASPEELLLLSEQLQEEIKEADVAGFADIEDLWEEERRMLEQMGVYYDDGSSPQPGEPVFTFVCAIADDDVDRAMTEAFQRARDDAARLAGAAGARLGRLSSVQSMSDAYNQAEDVYADYYNPYGYNAMYAELIARVRRRNPSEGGPVEAVGSRAGTVRYTVAITASFTLETGE